MKMKVEVVAIKNFGRVDYKPKNQLANDIAIWLKKGTLSDSDKKFLEKIGLEVVVLKPMFVKCLDTTL